MSKKKKEAEKSENSEFLKYCKALAPSGFTLDVANADALIFSWDKFCRITIRPKAHQTIERLQIGATEEEYKEYSDFVKAIEDHLDG